jgi:hypothetical protein
MRPEHVIIMVTYVPSHVAGMNELPSSQYLQSKKETKGSFSRKINHELITTKNIAIGVIPR